MEVRYRDLSVQSPQKEELLKAVDKVLSHGQILLGPEVTEFEKNVSEHNKTDFAVGVGCGTDAIFLSLKALGVGPGDEVITTSLSWIATANAVVSCGAKPIFVDINDDLNINPDVIENYITPKTKAIIPVHFTGRLCKMDKILEIAKNHNLHVIEDSAQAFGSNLNGKMAGSFGTTGCFSMNAMKNFSSFGEAGVISLNDKDLKDKLISLRYNGTINKEDCHTPSINSRIDTIHAAMMNINFKYLKSKVDRMREISHYYNQNLQNIVQCPVEDESYHTYYSYTILVEKRFALAAYLLDHGIQTKIQHPILMPFHTGYKEHNTELYIPVAIRLVSQILCLPNHEKLTDAQVDYVVDKVKKFFKK